MHQHAPYQRFNFLVLLASLIFAYAPFAQAQTTQTKIAVVDLNKLYLGLKELKTLQAEAKNRGFEIKSQVKKKTADLEQLQNELELAQKGSSTFEEKQAQLSRKAIELQVWQQFEQSRLQALEAKVTETLYRKVLTAVGQIAKSKNIDLVLQKDMVPPMKSLKATQLTSAVTSKRVLFASDQLDITEAVILKMNNDYESGQ